MRLKNYLYHNYSDKLISNVVKKAQKEGRVDPHSKFRSIATVAAHGLGGAIIGRQAQLAAQIKDAGNINGLINVSKDNRIEGGIIGSLAGMGAGIGLAMLTNRYNRASVKRLFKNAVDSGMITKKELNSYLDTGKVTPGIAKALNSTTVGDNISDISLKFPTIKF